MGDTFSLDPEPSGLFDVAGFRTGVASCGMKAKGPDIGVLVCDNPDGAGVAILTKNAVRAAPVRVSSPRATTGLLRAAIVNAGNANCHTGEDGLSGAREMVELTASDLDVPQERVIVASNGVLGCTLPMEQVRKGVQEACRDAKDTGRGDFAAAMVPRDVPYKIASVSGQIEGKPFRIVGVARDVSTPAPDVSTVFAFIATDVAMSPECLREILISVSERTFDRLIVDGGKGTNDTLCLFASGRAGNEIIDNVFSADFFADALEAVARQLVAGAVPGGDPATSPLEVRVSGAESERGAEAASRAVGQSVAVRTAIRGGDADWGVILAAAGRSVARVEDSCATVRLAGETVYQKGRAVDPLPDGLRDRLVGPGVTIELDLGFGSGTATIWAHALMGPNKEELQRAKRAASEAEAERESLHGELKKEQSAHKAATRETQVLRKRLKAAEGPGDGKKDAAKRPAREAKGSERETEELRKQLKLARQETKQVKVELSLKEQLVKQFMEGEKKHEKLVVKLEKQIQKLKSR